MRETLTANLVFEDADSFNNWIIIEIHELKIRIGGIYRSNSHLNSETAFLERTDPIISEYKKCIHMGDMNIDLLQHTNTTTNLCNQMVSQHHILNAITCEMPTRTTEHSAKIIDHFYTDIPHFEYKLALLKCSLTDHHIAILGLKSDIRLPTQKINCKYIDYEKIINEIAQVNTNDMNYGCLQQTITSIFSENTRQSSKITNNRKRYIKPYIWQMKFSHSSTYANDLTD